MTDFTDREKLEVIEHFIEQWRPAQNIRGERDVFLILKEIADEIRAREPQRAIETIVKLERAIGNAKKNRKRVLGYEPGNLREIAELVIGRWSTVRQALEKFGQEEAS